MFTPRNNLMSIYDMVKEHNNDEFYANYLLILLLPFALYFLQSVLK
jgi:hypothetical protein